MSLLESISAEAFEKFRAEYTEAVKDEIYCDIRIKEIEHLFLNEPEIYEGEKDSRIKIHTMKLDELAKRKANAWNEFQETMKKVKKDFVKRGDIEMLYNELREPSA